MTKYDSVLLASKEFCEHKLSFADLKYYLVGAHIAQLGIDRNYSGDLSKTMGRWMDSIEFCYPEKDWYELGCSAVKFISEVILNESDPPVLPMDDPVVRDNLRN